METPLQIGETVHHPRFGTGTVAALGLNRAEVTVQFGSVTPPRKIIASFLSREPIRFRPDRREPGAPLEVVNAADLAGKQPPPRQEHVEGMIPSGNVTLLGGDGGTGKSLLALQLAVATAARSPWIGLPVSGGCALFLTAEDEVDEVHRRLASICALEGRDMEGLADLDIVSLAGKDALLAVADDLVREDVVNAASGPGDTALVPEATHWGLLQVLDRVRDLKEELYSLLEARKGAA